MRILYRLLRDFFTHKDFLPPPQEVPGTLFSPLQILFCLLCGGMILLAALRCVKKRNASLKKIYVILWAIMLITEPLIVIYDACAGARVHLDLATALPFWPCSIYLFVLPFAVWGKGNVRLCACGYICTLGLLGGVINFFYPASYISYYSCLSFAGLRTIFFHGSMIFTALSMLLSGYHSFRRVTTLRQVFLPLVPVLLVSIPANVLNLVILGADYLFLGLESFFFAAIGRATPYLVSMLLTYLVYIIIHCVPYLPSYLANRRRGGEHRVTDFPESES